MNDPHFQKILDRMYSYNDYEYVDLDKREDVKECPLCHKLFYPEGRNGSRQRYCKRTHVVDCEVCGKPIPQKEASEKYGTVKYTCSKECASKLKIKRAQDTMLEKYGHSNPSQIPEFKEKISASLKAKAPETTAKVMATMQERYGGIGTASPVLREKIENTMMERYGVANPDDSPELREKMRAAALSDEAVEARKRASRLKYGSDFPTQSEEVQNIMKATLMQNWGVPYSGQIPESREKAAKTCLERYGAPNCMNSPESREKARQSMLESRKGRSSKLNRSFVEFLNEHGINNVTEEFYLEGKWFDFAIDDTNILIELDPTYSHATEPNHWNSEGLAPDYHNMKTTIAAGSGYRCIHLFDWDKWGVILEFLSAREKLYARKCKLQSIDPKSISSFIDANHIQGDARGAQYAYGLYYQNELVQVMTFGKSRYNRNYEWELLRLCSKSGIEVVGGASRLFKAFIRDVDPKSIISYCDRAKFTGAVYYKMGMTLHHISAPAKVWSKDDKYITDNLLRQRGYDQLFNANYGKGTSNEELMVENGWRSVYDCGQFVFEWRAK